MALKKCFRWVFIWTMLTLTGCISYESAPPPAAQTPPSPKYSTIPANAVPLPVVGKRLITPKQVILLLPLTGSLATAGTAVKDGFIAAQQLSNTAMNVETIDTAEVKPISKAYQRAIAKGADMVIGPLEKGAVAELAKQTSFPVTTIALNYQNTAMDVNPNFYQFGLSPLDEAQQVAEKAALRGHSSALIIAPAGEWGQGVTSAFTQVWQKQGGIIVKTINFNLQDNLAESLKTVTGNQPKQKESRFDMVFLAAPPAVARQLEPLLKFSYAKPIPVYATSFIYTGTPQPLLDRDLNGIIFCDIPWVLDPPPLAIELAEKEPHNFIENNRLYALGVDAYRLATDFYALQASRHSFIKGATGDLFMGDKQQIIRRLPWAIFKDGRAELLHDF